MRAFGERIIVQKILEPNKVKGIAISSEKVYNNTATVVSIGEELAGYTLKEGDIIKLAAESGTEMRHEGEEYLVIVKQNILAYL